MFSLTGEHLRRYELNHATYGISVDELNGSILITGVNKDEPMVKYRF